MRRMEDRVGKPTFALARIRHFAFGLRIRNATSRTEAKEKAAGDDPGGLFLASPKNGLRLLRLRPRLRQLRWQLGSASAAGASSVGSSGSAPGSAFGSNSSVKPASSRSNIDAMTSTPCACSSASSGERATLTLTVTADLGVQRDLDLVHADRLDRAVEHDLALGRPWRLRPSSASTMSRAETEP